MSDGIAEKPENIAGYRALLVDDSKAYRRMLRKILESSRMECHEAENGKEALSILTHAVSESNPFHLVFLDLNMPVLGGLETLREIRINDDLHPLPVIIISSESEKELVASCAHHGISNYLIKPFNPSRVLEAAGLALAQSKKGRAKKTEPEGPRTLTAEEIRDLYLKVQCMPVENNPTREMVLTILTEACPWLLS